MAFVPAWRLDTTPLNYTVDGMIPEIGIGFMYGPSLEGKSTVAFLMALDIVNGLPFFGHAVEKGEVIYCLGEGLYGAGVRKEAIIADSVHEEPAGDCRAMCPAGACTCTKTVSMTDDGLWLMSEPFSLADERELRTAITQMKKIGPDLRMVIIDAVSDFTGGVSLEFPTPAGRIIAGMKQIARELEVVVVAVHHTGNDKSRMRGAKRLFDASDFVIRVADRTISSEKAKDSKPFSPVDFELEEVGWIDQETQKLVSTVLAKEPEAPEEKPAAPAPEIRPPVPVLLRGEQVTGRVPKRTGIKPGPPQHKQMTWTKAQQYRAGSFVAFLCFLVPFIHQYWLH